MTGQDRGPGRGGGGGGIVWAAVLSWDTSAEDGSRGSKEKKNGEHANGNEGYSESGGGESGRACESARRRESMCTGWTWNCKEREKARPTLIVDLSRNH
jgi:hypothetical protein